MPHRPAIQGERHMVSSTHYLASTGGMRILEQGGNAADAGVAAGLCINMVETHLTQFGGVAPIIFCPASGASPQTISGLGRWPKAASIDYFRDHTGGDLPPGILRSVTPAAPDAWITALDRFGTMTFAQVVQPALELVENWPARYVGQKDMATTFRRLMEAEAGAGGDRHAGLKAARDLIYQGEIAREIAAFSEQEGGLLRAEDLADFQVRVEPPEHIDYKGYDVYSCGPWCQGPSLLMALNILEGFNLEEMGHNSADYLHVVVETMKLVFSDRHHYFGDPDFVQVPMAGLLCKAYARERAKAIDFTHAAPDMPAPGDPWPHHPEPRSETGPVPVAKVPGGEYPVTWERDTAYVCVVDGAGNAFSATPSDPIDWTPVIPGLGFGLSGRGSQTWLDPDHPSGLEPGKRPRLTPNPALVLKDGKPLMPFGCPGGDAQVQGMLQVFLNVVVFGMDPQAAVEAPRVVSHSFPNSFWPHGSRPGEAVVESRVDAGVRRVLSERGHKIQDDEAWSGGVSRMCAIFVDPETGMRIGGADPRGLSYAIGW
ncbi:MAG: gamma-glutamyltransferase [bacterium]|nr:gamma-glutamyltransferase [bacterium]